MIFKPFLFRFRDGVELSHLLGVAALNTQVSAITGSSGVSTSYFNTCREY
jgi:hypothetical protein